MTDEDRLIYSNLMREYSKWFDDIQGVGGVKDVLVKNPRSPEIVQLMLMVCPMTIWVVM